MVIWGMVYYAHNYKNGALGVGLLHCFTHLTPLSLAHAGFQWGVLKSEGQKYVCFVLSCNQLIAGGFLKWRYPKSLDHFSVATHGDLWIPHFNKPPM